MLFCVVLFWFGMLCVVLLCVRFLLGLGLLSLLLCVVFVLVFGGFCWVASLLFVVRVSVCVVVV